MTKSVKEWMMLLNESVSAEVEGLIEDPQVDEYYEFVSNAGVDLRGQIIAVDGEDYTLNSDGEIYHVSIENIGRKSFAGDITEGAIKALTRDNVDYQAIELSNGDIVAAKLTNGKISHYYGKSGKWFPTIIAKNGADPAIKRFDDADSALDEVSAASSGGDSASSSSAKSAVVKTYEKEGIKYSVSKVATGFVLSRPGKDGQPSYYSKTNKWFPSIVCNKGHAATIAVYKTVGDAIDTISTPLHESDRPRPRATIQKYMVKNDKNLSNKDHAALSAIVHLFAQGYNIDEDPEVFNAEFAKLSPKVDMEIEPLLGYGYYDNELIHESDRPRPRATIQKYMVKNDKNLSNKDHAALSAIVHLFAQGYNIDEDPEVFNAEFAKLSPKVDMEIEPLLGYGYYDNELIHESVLTEALNTKQIMAALAITLGLSTTAHAGLLTQMAAAVEDAAPKVGAAIVAKAKEAADATGKVYDEQSPKVVAAAKDAAVATKDAIGKYGPKVIDAAKDAGMTTADYVAKYYNEKSPEVINGAKKLGVSTAEYIKIQTPEVIAAAKKAGVSTADYLSAQYDDKSPAVKDAGKKAAKAAGNAVEDVADRSKRAAKEFVK